MSNHATLRLRTSKGKSLFPWLLVLALLGAVGWIFWKGGVPASEVAIPAKPLNRTNPLALVKTSLPVTKPPFQAALPKQPTQASNNPTPQRVVQPKPLPLLTNPPVQRPSELNRVTNTAVPADRVLEGQVGLVRSGISPGSVDATLGSQTRAGIRAFQRKTDLPVTGELDTLTLERLQNGPVFTNYIVTSDDLSRLQPLGETWLAKSQQDRLDYESALELVAEKNQTSPHLVRRLNPHLSWTNLIPGTSIKVPLCEFPAVQGKAATMRIFLSQRIMQAFDENTNLLAHFPCSIGQKAEKRPAGELHVAVVALNPNYTFDPDVFPESAEARELGRKLILQPGPNNPVGTVWIGLDKPGYGIHGTPRPEQVGRTESHGCFRLANWNADYLAKMVWVGMPVWVEP